MPNVACVGIVHRKAGLGGIDGGSAEPEAALKQQASARSRVLPGPGDHAMDNRKGDVADQDDEHLDKKMRDKAWVCADCSQVAIRS